MIAAAIVALGAAVAYQAAAHDRGYRSFLAEGDAAQRDGQSNAAIEAYSGAVALKPASMLAYLRRGETYERRADGARGDLQAAARDFRTAASLDPMAARPLEELGDVLSLMQRYDRAADSYEQCLQLDDRSSKVSYKLALARYRMGDVGAALATAAQTLRLDDALADAHYLRGLCLRDLNRLPEAQQALERAVALSPGLVAARDELANLYVALGRRSDELEQFQLLADLDRDRVERQVALGLVQAHAGHTDLAVFTLNAALDRAPGQPLVNRALGQVWLERAEARDDADDLKKALGALGRVAGQDDAPSEALVLYGRALLLDGEVEEAERTLRRAVSRFPVQPSAFTYYATAAERLNHLDVARRALLDYGKLAGDRDDFTPRARHIASLSLRLGEPAVAVDWLQRASSRNPGDVRILAELADAQLRAGDREAARATIARGLEKDPANTALLALAQREK
jgi:tetratricopeptide (TPR) repeat protein